MVWQHIKRDGSINGEDRRPPLLKHEDSVDRPLYHGSPVEGLKEIEPRSNWMKNPAHRQVIPPLVFLTDEIHIARLYASDWRTFLLSALQGKTPKHTGSVYRVKTRNKRFAKIPHPTHGHMYVSTDSVHVKRELRPDQNEPPLFTYGLPRLMLLICTGVLAFVFLLSWGLIAQE